MEPLLAAAIVGALASVALQPLVEIPIALLVTRRKVKADTAELVAQAREQLKVELVAELKPGVMRGGVDPRDAAARRWEREEEKRTTRARTEASVMAHLVPRLGEVKTRLFWEWLSPELRDSVLDAGERWGFVLEPLLSKLPKTVTQQAEDNPDQMRAVPMVTQ